MKKKRSHIFRGIASIFLALLVMFSVVSQVANAWSGKVNEMLGVDETTIRRSENPADYRYQSDFAAPSDLIRAEIDLNTRLSAEGTVALKGLPALSGKKVTLFGMRSGDKMQFGGSMGELTDASNVVTLGTALAANGFSVNPDMEEFYRGKAADYSPTRASGGNVIFDYFDETGKNLQGAEIHEVPVSEYDASLLGDYRDAAIVVFGRDAGESCCFYPGLNGLLNPDEFTKSPTGNILSLSNDERDLLAWVKEQGFGQIVVLLNSGSAMEIDELKHDAQVDSILWIGNPGAYGTYGIAKLLSGEVLPSGHLPDTFAVNSALSPAAQNYGIYTFANASEIETTKNNALRSSWYLVESEGIYTGYKYYETRYFDTVVGQGNASYSPAGQSTTGNVWSYDSEVSYGFGYGLEGSTFSEEITAADVDWTGEKESTVTVRVTNTGSAPAKHAVQLYVSVPYTQKDRQEGIEKAAIQLVGYAKTGEAQEKTFRDVVLLQPGASEDVTVTFNAADLYSYDMNYAHDGVEGAWLLESGDYWFATGNGAHEAVNAVLNAMNGTQLQTTGTARSETVGSDTYITTSASATIQNQLGEADLNSWNTDASVTYLTRNDWANTFPKAVQTITATQEMIFGLRNQIYNQELEKSLYTGPASFTYDAKNGVSAVQLIGLDYNDPLYDKALDQLSMQDYINQYISLIKEIPAIAMPREYSADSPLGIIGTIGQRSGGSIFAVSPETEGYRHFTNVYVSGPVVAATFSPLLQSEEGRLVANDCLWTGYTTWFAPGMNLHRTPYNGRNIGYYSEDPVLCGRASAYVHLALDKFGIITNAKHFAFNDQETNRDGIAVFLSEQAARENELRGFQIAIRDGRLKGLMSAFNRIGVTHVGAHKGLMNGILRGEWGWMGYLMTDSVKSSQYFLARECLVAGNDMMLGGSVNGQVWGMTVDEVSKDIVLQAGMREAYHRKLYTYVNSVVMNGLTAASASVGGQVWWVVMLQVIIGMSALCFVLFTILSLVWAKKERRQ